MTELQQKQLKVLMYEVAFRNSTNRSYSDYDKRCKYSGIGCAIGRLISDKKLCKKLDKYRSPAGFSLTSVTDVFKMLPEDIKSLDKYFLIDLQYLHDTEKHWTPQGLSEIGEKFVENIKSKFQLHNVCSSETQQEQTKHTV